MVGGAASRGEPRVYVGADAAHRGVAGPPFADRHQSLRGLPNKAVTCAWLQAVILAGTSAL